MIRQMLAYKTKKHWINLTHSDAACGAFGAWKIPMCAMACRKELITCKKCRALVCGPVDRRLWPERRRTRNPKAERRAAQRRAARKILSKLGQPLRSEFALGDPKQAWEYHYPGRTIPDAIVVSELGASVLISPCKLEGSSEPHRWMFESAQVARFLEAARIYFDWDNCFKKGTTK